MSQGERRLAAIMFTDIVGYTALAQADEAATMQLLEEHRKLIRPIFASHAGREIKTIGDAFLVQFGSALDATLCAIAVQSAMNDRRLARGERLAVRIGIHVGDIIERENDVLGDAVNIASRVEPLAEPGGICVTEQVCYQVKNMIPYPLFKIGMKELKNVREPVEVYRVVLPWDQPAVAPSSSFATNRIAILPFRNMSPDPNDDYFAEGITEEIISTVSGISGLKVISRTSVMGYKGTTKKVEEIGRELKVGSVLEGSFRKSGNKIRVTTQLISVAGDEHLWSQSYDRNLDDVFEVQSDVAKQVADALRVKILSPELKRIEKKPTESTSAYSLYLKGRFLWNKRGLDDLKKAADYFEQAVKEDPGFALGYVGEADCYLLLRNNFMIEKELNLERANEKVARALEVDSGLAEAHTTKAMILNTKYEYEEAEREFKRAIELNPSYATAHQWYYWLLHNQYRWNEARSEIERAQELDPLSPTIILNHSDILFVLGRSKEALDDLEVAERLGVANSATFMAKFQIHLYLGRKADAAADLERAAEFDPKDPFVLDWRGHLEYLEGNYVRAKELWDEAVAEGKKRSVDVRGFAADFAMLFWTIGEGKKALDFVEELKGLPEDTKESTAFKLVLLSYAYAGINDSEGLFSTLGKLVEAKGADFGFMRFVPVQMPLSVGLFRDPRWSALFKSVGLED